MLLRSVSVLSSLCLTVLFWFFYPVLAVPPWVGVGFFGLFFFGNYTNLYSVVHEY